MAALIAILLVPASALAYRPFVSTDAAVAEPKEVEIELGYFNLDRSHHENTISTSQRVRRPSGGRQVLAQTVETQPWAVAVLEDKRFSDADISVRFRPISGKEDASGGIIFRAKDGQNYLLVRANALENNFRLYTIVKGKRSTIASARVNEPKLGMWHTIRVVATGPKVEAYLKGARLLDHEEKTFTEGWIGLWTKADSVTELADLEITGTVAK